MTLTSQAIIPVGIAGLGSCLPDRVVTNHDLSKLVDTNDEWIVKRTGISERRWVSEGENCSDLAAEAGRRALADAGLEASDLDLIIVGTLSADYLMPSCAVLVQERLGADRAGAFDVASACTGFLTAMDAATAFVASGRAKTVLAIGTEALSRYLDMTDRTSCILFGDGAGAAVITTHEVAGNGEVLKSCLGSDGKGYDYITIPTGATKAPHNSPDYDRPNHFIRLRGREVYRFAVTKMTELIREMIEGYDPDDVALVVPHQVNMRIIESSLERLGWTEERCFLNIHRYGNTSAASVPIALDEAKREGRLVPGKLCVMVAFGAGLTWGANLIRW